MSQSWVERFPHANSQLLLKAESLFMSKFTIHQKLEAVSLFASVLEKPIPGDVDFFIVSDDPTLTHRADRWISMTLTNHWQPEFTPDFFFRVGTSLSLESLDGKRNDDRKIYHSILGGRSCVVFTHQQNTQKYLSRFPGAFVVQART